MTDVRHRWRPTPATEAIGALAFFVATALAITLLDESFRYVADARYEHVANPGQFLSRHRWLWDAQRGPGDPARYYSPFIGGYQTLLAAAGAAPWVIERLTHVLYLTLGATGARKVWTLLATGPAWIGLVAGSLYAYSPHTTEFLLPSGLYFPYALAPWFVVFTIRAARRKVSGPEAALFALAVASVGFLNTASLVLAMLPTAVVALRFVIGGRAAAMVRFFATAFGLTMLLSAPMILVALGSIAQLRFNLETTETAQTVGRTSSASESWRGLGFWITYFDQRRAEAATNAQWYFTSMPIALASFVPVGLAGYAMIKTRLELRRTLAIGAALAVVVMVGIHPVSDPSPFGQLLERGFDDIPTLRSFRSTYKVGAGLMLAVAVLGAAAIAQQRRAMQVVLVAACALAAIPFWTASIYPSGKTSGEIPSYWHEAFDWFEDRPGEDRVLVLPGLSRARYTWGDINDNLFDANLEQPVLMSQGLTYGTDEIADIGWWLDRNGTARIGLDASIAPVLRRLGVRWVIVQNDLNWDELSAGQQSASDRLMAEPGVEFAKGFGALGENLVARRGETAIRSVRPIQVFEVIGSASNVSTLSEPLLVSGGGEAWPALASVGLLDSPVQNLAPLDLPSETASALATAPLVVTDGGRRRAMRVTPTQVAFSHTLSPGEESQRVHQTLSEDLDTQTVAEYIDVASVSASTYGRFDQDWPTAWRAAAATDQDPSTAWAIWGIGSGTDETLTIELGRARLLERLSITPYAANQAARRITRLRVVLIDGEGIEIVKVVDLPAQQSPVDVPIPAGTYMQAKFTIISTSSVTPDAVGLREVTLHAADGTVDAREWLRVPRVHLGLDVAEAPQFLFSRWVTDATGLPEDRSIRRIFETDTEASFGLIAQLRVTDQTSDEMLARLVGGPMRVTAATRADGINAAGIQLVDGDSLTAWNVAGWLGGEAEITLRPVRASTALVDIIVTEGVRRPKSLEMRIEGSDGMSIKSVELPREPNCLYRDAPPCIEQMRIPFDEDTVSRLELTVPSDPESNGRFRIGEVRLLLGDFAAVFPPADGDKCAALLSVDGQVVGVRGTAEITMQSLSSGVEVQSCDDITLAAGVHTLDATLGASTIDIVQVIPVGWKAPVAPASRVDSLRSNPTELTVTLPPGPATFLVTNVPSHGGWRLEAADTGLRQTSELSVDAAVTFAVSSRTEVTEFRIFYGPQRFYNFALGLALAGLIGCAVIIYRGRRQHLGESISSSHPTMPRWFAFVDRPHAAPKVAQVGVVIGVGVLGYAIGGTTVAIASLIAAAIAFVRPTWVNAAAVFAIPVVALATVLESDLEVTDIGEFAARRPLSHTLGLIAVTLWLMAAVLTTGVSGAKAAPDKRPEAA